MPECPTPSMTPGEWPAKLGSVTADPEATVACSPIPCPLATSTRGIIVGKRVRGHILQVMDRCGRFLNGKLGSACTFGAPAPPTQRALQRKGCALDAALAIVDAANESRQALGTDVPRKMRTK